MGQCFDLVSTPRTRPTVRSTLGDFSLAFAGAVPIAYLALFDPGDIHVLPWDRTVRQLTLLAAKAPALARLEQRAPGIAKRLARDFSVLAARQAKRGVQGGLRPSGATLLAALGDFARRVAAAPGTHVQAFLDDSYYPWHEDARAQLVEMLSAADGAEAGWSTFLAFSEVANSTTPPWEERDIENVLTGCPCSGSGTHDSLASWLAEGELLPGTLTAVCEALGATYGVRGRPPRLAELLGALARVIGDGVVLRVATTQGTVTACMPPPEVDDRLPRASLPALARGEGLFTQLAEVWALAAQGALADGALECSALERDTGALAVALPEGTPEPFEPFVLALEPDRPAAFEDIEDADALAAVLADPDPRVRVALIEDVGDGLCDVATATATRLLADPCPAVRAAMVRLGDLPLAMPASERHPGVRASSHAAHPGELTMLAAHPEPSVRVAVARNIQTPVRTACQLARDPEVEVRRAVVWPLCLAAFSTGRGDVAAQAAVLALAGDAAAAVRLEVGRSLGHQDPNSDRIAALLAEDPDPEVAKVGRWLREPADDGSTSL